MRNNTHSKFWLHFGNVFVRFKWPNVWRAMVYLTIISRAWMGCESIAHEAKGPNAGQNSMSLYSSEFQSPLFKGLRRRLCPWRYFTINYYCICHCSCPCHNRNSYWYHFVNISSVLQCYFKVMSPQIFSPTGPQLCNIAH